MEQLQIFFWFYGLQQTNWKIVSAPSFRHFVTLVCFAGFKGAINKERDRRTDRQTDIQLKRKDKRKSVKTKA